MKRVVPAMNASPSAERRADSRFRQLLLASHPSAWPRRFLLLAVLTLRLAFALVASSLLCTAGSAAVTSIPPFSGTITESWETMSAGGRPSPISVFNGYAVLQATAPFIYWPAGGWTWGLYGYGYAPVADGVRAFGHNSSGGVTTIVFNLPVSQFGAYWGNGGPGYPLLNVRLYDASNNLLNTAVVNYSGGALLWSGWQSDTPVKRVEFNGTYPVVDSLQATLAPFPEIALEGNSVNIADGDSTPTTADHTDFGGVPTVGGTVTRTFTVRNTGNAVLNLTGTPKVTVSGAHAADFTVSVQPASPVASGGGTSTFEVIFNPNGDGLRSATLSLANSDSDENPFDFAIRGTGLNLAPAAGDDTYSVAEDTTLTVTAPGVLGNDSDPESGTLTVAPATPPAHGALTLHAAGGFYYTPSPNYFGPDSFTYLVSDPAGNTATATANLTVVPVNDPTILAADAAGVTVDEGSSATMTGTFSDVEGNESIVLTASVGTIRQDNLAGTWSWTHTPTEGPSSIQVLLTAHDGGNPPVTTSFAVDVRNAPPSFDLGPAVTVPLSANGQFSADQVTINDPGEDMWSVYINYGDGSPTERVPPNPGVRAFSLSHRYAARGSYTVTVDVSDGLTSATDTTQVTVLLNSAPAADAAGPYTLDAGSPLALDGSGTDPDMGDSLTFAWDLNNDGTFDDANGATPTVPPAALAALGLRNGAHTIRLRVSDGAGASATSSTTLTIRGTQTIALSAIGDHVFGEAPFTISATASSGLPVTFTSLMPGVVTVSGNTVTLVAAGTATVRASQAGDANWQPAADTELSFRVAKATPLVAWAKPADINCLTPLGPAQFGATANLPGVFTYTPAAGSLLPPGNNQTLTAAFTPTDSANYESVSITAEIDVRVDAVGELWARRFGGDYNAEPDEATSMRVDADCNVVVVGKIFIGGRTHSYTAKYTAASGSLFWERIYSGPDNQYDEATALALDREGNALVAGVSWSTSGHADIYTAKYAAATGAVLWERRYDGPTHWNDEPATVAVDSNGDVIVTGASEFDFYTAKYAGTDGALLWERRYNGPGRSYDQPTALAADAAGNVIVTGYSQGTGPRPDYYTAKYAAADGALLWERRYEGPGRWWDQPTAVAVDANGDVVVTGFSSGDGTQADYYTAKYAAADGAIVWENRFDGPGYLDPMLGILSQDEATALGLDAEGNVLVTGRSTDTLGNLEFCTLKYASVDGALVWGKRYHGPASDTTDDEPAALVADGQGNVIVTGRSRAPGPSGNSDFYTAKYAAADGALLWEKRYNAAYDRSAWASARALALLPNGDVILAGSVRIGADASDMLTVRLRPTPEPVVALLGPASLSIDLNGVFDDPGATATDACGVALPVTIAGTLNVHAAGTYALTYLATDVAGRSSQVTRRITVDQGQQTISFAPIIGRSYGDAPFNIAATASSGLPVTFTSLTPTVVVDGDRVTILAAGDAIIRASQAGNADYQPAAYVDRTFTVAKAAPKITWPTPSAITSSTPLSGSELNATADTAGSFAYFPSAGTRVPRGLQTLSATFTPTDSGNFAVAMKTVSLTVLNSPPWASPQSVTGVEDVILPITLAGTDADADPLTFTVVDGPTHGTLSGTALTLTYTPAANYHGPDSFSFKANDGTVDSSPATVAITVTPVNDPPVAGSDTYATDEDTRLVVNNPGLLGNDTDADEGPLPRFRFRGRMTANTADFNDGDQFEGFYTVDPAAPILMRFADGGVFRSTWSDTRLAWEIRFPGRGYRFIGSGYMNQVGNDTASGDYYYVGLGNLQSTGAPTASGVMPSGFNLEFRDPVHSGADLVHDDSAQPNTLDLASAPIAYLAVGYPGTTAVMSSRLTMVRGPREIESVNGDPAAVNTAITLASGARLRVNRDGTFRYDPSGAFDRLPPGSSARETFSYEMSDPDGGRSGASVTIEIAGLNDLPSATPQTLETYDNQPIAITLAGTDSETASLGYRILSGPAAGRLSGTPPNVVYTPPFPYAGNDRFTFEVDDGQGGTAVAAVDLAIRASDRPPVAAAGDDQRVVAGPDCQATVGVDGRASTDPDGDALSFRWELRQSGQVLDTVTGHAVASWSLPRGNYEAVLMVSTDKNGTLVRNSDTLTIDVQAGAPALTALNPASAYADGAGFNLTVTGGCFLPGAVVQWNGAPRPTTVVDGSQLTAAIPAADLQTGVAMSVATVRVVNGDGQISGPLAFSIVARTVRVADAAVAQPGQATSASTAPTAPGEPGVSITVLNNGNEPVSVLAATYETKPVGETAFRVDNGAFVDVQVTGANPNVAATVYFYYPSGVTGPVENRVKLRYFDGANWIPVLSRGGLSPVKDTTDNLDGTMSGGRFSVVFDMTSTPRITDLAGTVFGMFESEPQLRPITGPAGPVALGNAVGITVSFAIVGDPADAAVRFVWDDGTESIMAPTSATSGTATHLYATPGVYGLTVQVMDAAGDVSEGRFEYVVVYDPNGGFVTGGGWLESPAGAYLYDAALTGRATFGFNSKYLKGQSVPTGQTQFQFQAGDFKFHSTAYEWLVVSGAKAQYRGVGQVNGTGDYGFLLTATDGQVGGGGGVDKFRIKIWNRASHAILYDNRRGTSDDLDRADPQAIGGGSIVIQKGK